jgi:transposase
MSETLSEDLRLRVIAAVDGGLSRRAAVERFNVAVSTAVRWVRAWRETGATKAKPKGGDLRSQRIEAYRDVILAAVDTKKDITLAELVEMLDREHGAHFAISTIWRFFDARA